MSKRVPTWGDIKKIKAEIKDLVDHFARLEGGSVDELAAQRKHRQDVELLVQRQAEASERVRAFVVRSDKSTLEEIEKLKARVAELEEPEGVVGDTNYWGGSIVTNDIPWRGTNTGPSRIDQTDNLYD
jgi:hypothetical protein